LFFHHYEANYGELSQVVKLEQRMKELFTNDRLDLFANRFQTTVPYVQPFDPTSVRPIISIKAQCRPSVLQSIEKHQSPLPQASASPAPFSPRPANAHLALSEQQARFSPKRPFLPDPTNEDLAPPRKVARGESPFKGAAGRRVNAAKGGQTATPALPRDVTIFLSILPRSEQSNRLPSLNTGALMTLLRHVNLTQVQHHAQSMQRVGSGQGYQPTAHYGYPQR
jgi:cleavage stimulation factor subunit 3